MCWGSKGSRIRRCCRGPKRSKNKTFEILRQLAVNGSRRRPLVLVLEDLHWIDTLSHEFVGYLAESVPGAGILVLATYRPEYRPPWIDKSYAEQIALQPLSPDDSLHVVRSVLRDDVPGRPGDRGDRRQGRRQPAVSRTAGTACRRGQGPPLGADGAGHDP